MGPSSRLIFLGTLILAVPATAVAADLGDWLGPTTHARAVASNPDGTLIAVGSTYTGPAPDRDLFVSRYAADGTPDLSFGLGGVVTMVGGSTAEAGEDVVVQPDGKIVVAGGSNGAAVVVRLLADGSPDPSFGSGGVATIVDLRIAHAVRLQDDGRIVVVGTGFVGMYGDLALARLDSDGSLDAGFSDDGVAHIDQAWFLSGGLALAIQADGGILAAGGAEEYRAVIARFNSNGDLDSSFAGDGIVELGDIDSFHDLALQDDGAILAVGHAQQSGTSFDPQVVRFLADGSLDPTWGVGGIVDLSFPWGSHRETKLALVIRGDGSVVVAGNCAGRGDWGFWLLRLASDGSFDTTFDADGMLRIEMGGQVWYGGDGGACDVVERADGTLVAAGWWQHGGSQQAAIVSVHSDGTLDTSFEGDGYFVESDCRRRPIAPSECRSATESRISLKSPHSGRSTAKWRWSRGETFTIADIGTPDVDDRFTLCFYEETAGPTSRLTGWLDAFGNSESWLELASGWKTVKDFGNLDGVSRVLLRAAVDTGPSGASLTASRYGPIPIPLPVGDGTYFAPGTTLVVQLVSANGLCLQSRFPAEDARLNDDTRFKATSVAP